jgi:SAM-dependent methyltransferase
MDRSHLDLFWKNISTLPYFRGFLRAVEGKFFKELDLSVPILDLGNGDGHFTSVTFSKSINIGIDPEFKELLDARYRKSCDSHVCGEGNALPFQDGYFSSVLSNSVLEHIKDLDPVLEELFRTLKSSGHFILTVPNNYFSNNLSIALFLEQVGLNKCAQNYRIFFNKISRHYHIDSAVHWKEKLEKFGFKIIKTWNYFPKKSLWILEWGHFFGFPSWIIKKIFGKWILFPSRWNLFFITCWLKSHFMQNQRSPEGAYTFFITKKS